MKAYVLKGLPASGKSTWAEKNQVEKEAVIINDDAIRDRIYSTVGHRDWSPEIQDWVHKERTCQIINCAKNGFNIIVDNTHLNPKTLQKLLELLDDLGYEVEFVDFTYVSYWECVKRDKNRPEHKRVGQKVISDVYNKYMAKNCTLPSYEPNHLTDCLIVDIDGTLADSGNRSPFDESLVGQDSVRRHVLMAVKGMLAINPFTKLFVFSGRSTACYDDTFQWLHDKCNLTNFELHMRTVGDTRRDSLVKTNLYKKNVEGKYNVIAVFEDRPQVIRECWNVLKLPVFNCGILDFEF